MDVEHTKALAEKATPGPWVLTGPSDGWIGAYWSIGTEVDGLFERFTGDVGGALDNTKADAEFIAHARTAVPALVAAVERVQALHTKSNQGYGEDDYCDCCGTIWPCDTRKALEAP